MANIFQREPIDGGDTGVWGIPELRQNRAGTIGQLTAQIYNDGGVLKVSKGLIGFDNDSNKGIIIVDTITTISIAALTASRWALVEVSISGTTPSFTVTSLAAENDPGAIPTTEFTDVYDPEKQGFYYVSNERVLGLVWINSGDAIEGIVNCLPFVDGFQGYSTTDDALDQIYRWEKDVENTVDGNYVGRLHVIPEDERPSTFVLNAGSDTSWTEVDFSAYVPKGVKALLLYGYARLVGDNVADVCNIFIRQKGSTEVTTVRLYTLTVEHVNLAAGLNVRAGGNMIVLCDTDGIVEYYINDAQGRAYVNISGYFLPENAG